MVSYDKAERVYNPPMPLLFQWQRRLEDRPVGETSLRGYLDNALAAIGVKNASGQLLRYTFHDFRRIFITDAILHGMPPHIAQLVAGHRDINTTMGYKAVYPEEVINGHRAFIARRRSLRPAAEYRVPTDEEWAEFLGHFNAARSPSAAAAVPTRPRASTSTPACAARFSGPTRPASPAGADLRNLTARIAEAEQTTGSARPGPEMALPRPGGWPDEPDHQPV